MRRRLALIGCAGFDPQERKRSREMLASARVKYIPVAQDYAVEVPPQNPLDGVSRGLPISNTPEAHKSMRSKVPDVPEHIEQWPFPRCFHRDIKSEIGENQRACAGVEEHDLIQR